MTITEFNVKVRDLIKELDVDLIKDCVKLAESGGIDLEGFSDNYEAPKIVLKAAMLNYANSIGLPYAERNNKIVKNLESF